MPTGLEISRSVRLQPLDQVATTMGIGRHLLEPYGDAVAKIKLEAVETLADRPPAKYVVVTAITPTPLGEGKTTTTVGLGQAFSHIGKRGVIAIRQPSMGATFGIKGGGSGGGWSSDPTLKGAPTGWRLPVREVRASVGAGFVYPICGDMRTMPGLPMHPAVQRIDLDDDGRVAGLQ